MVQVELELLGQVPNSVRLRGEELNVNHLQCVGVHLHLSESLVGVPHICVFVGF